jgi:hypothetical protein
MPPIRFLLFTQIGKNVIIPKGERCCLSKMPENGAFAYDKKVRRFLMKIRINTESCKNAMGTLFLLATAFFVCSTFISMRSVFADPIAPTNTNLQQSGRQSPRSSRTTTNKTVSRSTVSRGVNTVAPTTEKNTVSRGVASRSVASRADVQTRSNNSTSRGVSSRTQKSAATRNTNNRAIRARTTGTTSRVGVMGSAMSGGRASTSTSYSYLSSRLYTGNYSNIIDSSTGLISADAYSNCLDSYYTCMDEICTARSTTKGRCSCAGRATNFLAAEDALEKANEELITLSGQLSLLIATKGKGDDLAAAFSLTDAEKVMNCVSWKEATDKEQWYKDHPTYTSANSNNLVTSYNNAPYYCSNNNFGFEIGAIDGSGSDILAQLKAWADAKDLAKQYTSDDSNNLLNQFTSISGIVNALSGITVDIDSDEASLDSLADKWGYKLFEYAHNNVCGRVLDSCFNGIYEGCGNPGTLTDSDGKTHSKCATSATTNCPFNYNSYISVDGTTGDVVLNERGSSSASITATSSCFGYSTTTTTGTRSGVTASSSSDPYVSLRGPVADARRSIMQKYLLDANSACDVYGEALKKTAQNINYQKIAAEQALQQKRLEFVQEEEERILAEATTAIDNFNECISEIWDCYENFEEEEKWTTARIKAYCAQVSQVPHCYETMICSPLQSQLAAVVDKPDATSCNFSNDYTTNTCRNVVTISEILYGTGANNPIDVTTATSTIRDSSAIREGCLQKALNCGSLAPYGEEKGCLRNWTKLDQNNADD